MNIGVRDEATTYALEAQSVSKMGRWFIVSDGRRQQFQKYNI